MIELVGVESPSKLVEGCRLTLSAISFARRVVRHSETMSRNCKVLMSVRVCVVRIKGIMMEISSRCEELSIAGI
jgi:hypothetical protein